MRLLPEPDRAERGVLRAGAHAASCASSAAPTAARGAIRRAIGARRADRTRSTWDARQRPRPRVLVDVTHQPLDPAFDGRRTRSSSSSSTKARGSSATSRDIATERPRARPARRSRARAGLRHGRARALPARVVASARMELWELIAREAIRETVASYAHCVDSGRFDDVVAAVRARRRARGARAGRRRRVATRSRAFFARRRHRPRRHDDRPADPPPHVEPEHRRASSPTEATAALLLPRR